MREKKFKRVTVHLLRVSVNVEYYFNLYDIFTALYHIKSHCRVVIYIIKIQ